MFEAASNGTVTELPADVIHLAAQSFTIDQLTDMLEICDSEIAQTNLDIKNERGNWRNRGNPKKLNATVDGLLSRRRHFQDMKIEVAKKLTDLLRHS